MSYKPLSPGKESSRSGSQPCSTLRWPARPETLTWQIMEGQKQCSNLSCLHSLPLNPPDRTERQPTTCLPPPTLSPPTAAGLVGTEWHGWWRQEHIPTAGYTLPWEWCPETKVCSYENDHGGMGCFQQLRPHTGRKSLETPGVQVRENRSVNHRHPLGNRRKTG